MKQWHTMPTLFPAVCKDPKPAADIQCLPGLRGVDKIDVNPLKNN